MIRRLRSACAGVLLVGIWAISAHAVAKPPDLPEDGTVTATPDASPSAPTIEVLPMPREEPDLTCPYLRQKMIDRHATQIADPDMGREVLDNLKRLKQADDLLELAKILARDGLLAEAMECCDRAAKLCPGSPCAQRAIDRMHRMARGIVSPTNDTEESAEARTDEPSGSCSEWDLFWLQLFREAGLPLKPRALQMLDETDDLEKQWEQIWFAEMPSHLTPEEVHGRQQRACTATPIAHDEATEPSVEPMVAGLMDSCYILMRQGMFHEAAQLARQAYALDPERVLADPLVYKMHLLTQSPASQPDGSNEESEPPTCPYCSNAGKPIREIVPEKTPSAVDYELEIGVNDNDGLHMCGDCSLGGSVYHLRYKHGNLSFWKTPDAGKTKP